MRSQQAGSFWPMILISRLINYYMINVCIVNMKLGKKMIITKNWKLEILYSKTT